MPSVFEVARLELQKQERKRLRDKALAAAALAQATRADSDMVNMVANTLFGMPDFYQQMMAGGCLATMRGDGHIVVWNKGRGRLTSIGDAASLDGTLRFLGLL